MSQLDFTTPEGRAAYRRELANVARPLRLAGFTLTIAGVLTGLTRFFMDPWPYWLRGVALICCVVGVALLLIGLFQRTRYHLRRMAGEN
ncbi:MAG: hypothetical protein AB7P07_02385 [Hyphomonadaceae bacterium]